MDHKTKPYHYFGCAEIDDSDTDNCSSTRNDLARSLITTLCKTDGVDSLENIISVQFSALRDSGIKSVEELQEFCKGFPQCFTVHPPSSDRDSKEVEVAASIRICPRHVKKVGSCPEDGACGCLHMCKFFLLSGKCEFSKQEQIQCHFGHSLWSDHNALVLKVSIG